jgi:hypothetical protein
MIRDVESEPNECRRNEERSAVDAIKIAASSFVLGMLAGFWLLWHMGAICH